MREMERRKGGMADVVAGRPSEGTAKGRKAGNGGVPLVVPPFPRSALPPMIIAASHAMRAVVESARRAAEGAHPVLVLGETGVGKDLIAEAIHQWSPLARKPLVAVDCGMHRGELLSNQLFGHDREAFTGAAHVTDGLIAQADGGTLFLDEVSSLGPEDQARLLRLLESGEYRRVGGTRELRSSFRLVAAANGHLQADLSTGVFRRDLFHRMAHHVIRIPPLRERPEDLFSLAREFMRRSGRELAPGVDPVLHRYQWPGNVRELLSAVERVVCATDVVAPSPEVWCAAIRDGEMPETVAADAASAESGELLETCARHRWKISAAATELGIHRATLYRRLAGQGYWRERIRGLRREARKQAGSQYRWPSRLPV